MVKIINKGLSEKGSKTMKTFDPNTDMGNVRFCDTRVPLSWLNYELKKV